MLNLMPDPVRRLLRIMGVDRAVGYALIGQGGAMLIQPITLFVIASCLTEQEQGFFYAFGGVIALQAFFDLGLGLATLHFASHEAGHLTWTAGDILTGDPIAKSRLASVLRLSLIWYSVIAVALVATLVPVGWLYFLKREGSGVAWQAAWVWTVLGAAGLLLTVPLVQFLAACGKMVETMRAMAVQRLGMGLAQCLVLIAGGKLLSWPISQTLGVAVIAFWLRYWYPAFRDLLKHAGEGPQVNWWREVWPFQWKVVVSSFAFFMTAQAFTLVLFDKTPAGQAEAGRMGISLQVMSALVSATVIWINARVPTFCHLIARRDWSGLDQVFRRVFVQSVGVATAAAVAVWIVFVLLRAADVELGRRVLPAWPLGLLLANVVVQTMVHALNSYLRAHRREPFVWSFAIMGGAMLIAVTIARSYGAVGMAASLLILNTTICLGGGSLIFVRCRRAWHAEPAILDPLST